MRRLPREPSDEDDKEVEKLRRLLTAQLDMLDSHPHRPNTIGTNEVVRDQPAVDESKFDEVDVPAEIKSLLAMESIGNNEEADINSGDANAVGEGISQFDNVVVVPERRVLSIPSNWISADDTIRDIELAQRVQQAARALGELRDLIADKSFQFSHVIRVAPGKGVKTRARSYIAKLNLRISYHCRVYSRCRAALQSLGADVEILNKYQTLKIEDLRSSTALINPNQPGSTKVQLSWIWQTGLNGGETTSGALRECEFLSKTRVLILQNSYS